MRERPFNTGKSDWLMDAGPADDVLDDDRSIPSARGVLSKAEIEALLRPETLDEITPQPEPEVIRPRLPVQFDAPTPEPVDQKARQEAAILASR